MIGFPSADARRHYDFMQPQLKDAGSSDDGVPGRVHVQGGPEPPRRGRRTRSRSRSAEMDRHGIAIGLVGLGGEVTKRALARAPRPVRRQPRDRPQRHHRRGARASARRTTSTASRPSRRSPPGCNPQVPVSDRRYYPVYQTCIDLDIPIIVNAGIAGPRLPSACQDVMHFDQVCYDFPELRIVMRHGAEPWEELAVKLMLKWPGLYYMTSAFAPKYYPKAIVDYANTRGADKVMYAGYYPMGLSLERIFAELPDVPFRDHVWPKFLRENAVRVFKLEPDGDAGASSTRAASTTRRRSTPSSRCCAAGRRRCASAATSATSSRASPSCSASAAGSCATPARRRSYLAVELLGLAAGRRGHHLAGRRSRPTSRRWSAPALVPVFVDVEPDTYNLDVDGIEAMIGRPDEGDPGARTSSATRPTGTASGRSPTRHGLQVVEDSCDALGPTLRGTPTGTRSDIIVTSFALSHIITAAGTGGMVLRRRRRAGRPLPAAAPLGPALRGPALRLDARATTRASSRSIDDGLEYDNLFIFDEVGWNFEPSELSAAFGLVQLRKLPDEPRPRRQRNFARLCERFGTPARRVRAAPHARRASTPPGTCSRCCSGPSRASAGRDFQQHMEAPRRRHPHGVDRQRAAPARVQGHRRTGAAPAGCPTPTG